jgi:nitroreductase
MGAGCPEGGSETQVSILDLLSSRVSHPRLSEPAPSGAQLEAIYQAALRTPDHMRLKPWRYMVLEGDSLVRLGELFCQAANAEEGTLSEAQEAKYRAMPLRAPMMIIGISKNIEHAKVPIEEQQVSCGVAMGYMLLAIQAQGFGGMWRTGSLAFNAYLKAELAMAPEESIVGFLYIGTPVGDPKTLGPVDSSNYFQTW